MKKQPLLWMTIAAALLSGCTGHREHHPQVTFTVDTVRTDTTASCQRQDYWPFFAIFNVRYWSLMLSAFRHFIITDWRGVFCQHSRFAFFL